MSNAYIITCIFNKTSWRDGYGNSTTGELRIFKSFLNVDKYTVIPFIDANSCGKRIPQAVKATKISSAIPAHRMEITKHI